MKTYGVGVLGCGGVWNYHQHAFANSKRIKVVSVFDPVKERAQQAAALTGARVAETAEEVLTDPQVDIAALLTPVFTHVKHVEIATKAGKHLMLEKPMATTTADGKKIVRAIDKAKVKCFHPTIRALSSDLFDELKKWTAPDGPVGPVKCAFYQLVGTSYSPTSAWLYNRELCFPPAEYDPHAFDTFLALTGDEAETVSCFSGNFARPFDQDDVHSMNITFKNRRYLQFDVHWVVDPSWKCGSRINFEFICERGMIKHNWWSAEWFNDKEQGSFASARQKTGGQRWDHYHALIDAIENNVEIHPDHHDALKYVRIQDAAIRSAKLKKMVKVQS